MKLARGWCDQVSFNDTSSFNYSYEHTASHMNFLPTYTYFGKWISNACLVSRKCQFKNRNGKRMFAV